MRVDQAELITYFYSFWKNKNEQRNGQALSRTFLYTDIIQYSAKLNQNAFQLAETETARSG